MLRDLVAVSFLLEGMLLRLVRHTLARNHLNLQDNDLSSVKAKLVFVLSGVIEMHSTINMLKY